MLKYSRVRRNPDSRFDCWFEAVAPNIDTLKQGALTQVEHSPWEFMRSVIDVPHHEAVLSDDSLDRLLRWGEVQAGSGWVQQGECAILFEQIVQD